MKRSHDLTFARSVTDGEVYRLAFDVSHYRFDLTDHMRGLVVVALVARDYFLELFNRLFERVVVGKGHFPTLDIESN